jgi:hypothetical protein
MAFNLMIGGLDEANTGSTMFKNMQYYDPVTQEVATRPVVIPIDKGYALPDLTKADWCEQFVWQNWPGAETSFCPEVARKIMSFNPKEAISGLQTVYDEASRSSKTERMLPEGSYCSLIATSVALKLAVEYNLPIKDIANKMNALMRSDVPNRYKAMKNKSEYQGPSGRLKLMNDFQKECDKIFRESIQKTLVAQKRASSSSTSALPPRKDVDDEKESST